MLHQIATNTEQTTTEIARGPKGWKFWLPIGIALAALTIGVGDYLVGRANLEVATQTLEEVQGLNTAYTAELIRRGPFDEALPVGVSAHDLFSANVSNATNAIDVVALDLDNTLDETHPFWAHFETYRSHEQANERYQFSVVEAAERYGASFATGEQASQNRTYCAPVDGPPRSFWQCGGYSGVVYVEVTYADGSNAGMGPASGVLMALLRYADSRQRLATE